jgi:hypothetical protein
MKRFEAWPSGTLPVPKRTRRQLAVVTFAFLDLFPELRDLVYQVLEPWDLEPLLATCTLLRREAGRYLPHVKHALVACPSCNVGGLLPSWNVVPGFIRALYEAGLWPLFGEATVKSVVHGRYRLDDSMNIGHMALTQSAGDYVEIVFNSPSYVSPGWQVNVISPDLILALRAPTLAELMADEGWPDVVATARRIAAATQ